MEQVTEALDDLKNGRRGTVPPIEPMKEKKEKKLSCHKRMTLITVEESAYGFRWRKKGEVPPSVKGTSETLFTDPTYPYTDIESPRKRLPIRIL